MVVKLCADLSADGYEIAVLTFGKSAPATKAPYAVVKAKSKMDFFKQIWRMAEKADIIYAFDLYTAGFLSWLVGKKLFSKKLIIRFAGDSAWESAYNSGRAKDDIVVFQRKKYGFWVDLLKAIRRRIMMDADAVVAVSRFMKKLAVLMGVKPEKVHVIYNSVDFVLSGGEAKDMRSRHEIPPHSKLIVTAGRLVPWKGVDRLIEVVAKFNATKVFFPVMLLIVGDGPEMEKLKMLAAKKGVGRQVVFAGKIGMEEIFDYYKAADVFVLNSKYEGLSHVLLEALKVGAPIVASSSGGNPEVIKDGENGLLVEYNNVSQIASAIGRVFKEDKWRAPDYKRICLDSLEKFSWKDNLERTRQIFNKL